MADDPHRADEAMRLCGDVELAEEGAAVRSGDPGLRIDLDAAHVRKADHEAAIRSGEGSCGVPAGLDRDIEVVLASERDRRGDLPSVARPSDQRRSPIMDPVPQSPRLVEAGVTRGQRVTARSPQVLDVASEAGRNVCIAQSAGAISSSFGK